MPKIANWDSLPPNGRQHLMDRMRDRSISIADLNQLRLWIASQPEVPEGDWFKTSVPSNSAPAARSPKRSYFAASPPKANPYSKEYSVTAMLATPDLSSRPLRLTHAGFPDAPFALRSVLRSEESRLRHDQTWPMVLAHLDHRLALPT